MIYILLLLLYIFIYRVTNDKIVIKSCDTYYKGSVPTFGDFKYE